MHNWRITVFILTIVIVPFMLQAEEKSAAGPQKRKVVVFTVSDISKDTKIENEELFQNSIRDNISLELKVAGFDIIDEREWKAGQRELRIGNDELFEGPVAMRLAESISADVAITGFLLMSQKKILFGIKCYDVKAKRLAATVIRSGRAGLAVMSLINEAVDEIVPKIKKGLDIYIVKEGEIEKQVTVYQDITLTQMRTMGEPVNIVLLSRDEGASVYLADKLEGTITEGTITVRANTNAKLIVRMEKEGFYPSVQELEISGENPTLTLRDLNKISSMFEPELNYAAFQFLGIGVGMRYYPVTEWFDQTNWTFLNLNNYIYLDYDFRKDSNIVIHNDLNLSINQYLFFDPGSLFRLGLYLSAGITLTIFTVPDMPVFADFYLDIFGLWVELNFSDFIVYFKQSARFYLPIGDIIKNELLGMGMGQIPYPSIGVVWKW